MGVGSGFPGTGANRRCFWREVIWGGNGHASASAPLWWMLALATVLLAMSLASGARADTPKWVTIGPDCVLPYSPFAHETATPRAYYDDTSVDPSEFSFMCSLDQDDDGFDDNIESVIADCFAPYLKFDSAENALTIAPKFPGTSKGFGSEPVALYTFDPPKQVQTGSVKTAALQWALVYTKDGGYYKASGLAGKHNWGDPWNSHVGDTESIHMTVELRKLGLDWVAHLRSVQAGVAWDEEGPTQGDSQVSCYDHFISNFPPVSEHICKRGKVEHLELVGTHPVVYPSAGKHHQYLHPISAFNFRDLVAHLAQYPITLYVQYDRADGQGPSFVPGTYTANGRAHNVGRVVSASSLTPPSPEEQEHACEEQGHRELLRSTLCECVGPECPPQPPPEDCSALLLEIASLAQVCAGSPGAGKPARNECMARRKGGDWPSGFLSDQDLHIWWPKANIASGENFCGDLVEGCYAEENKRARPILDIIKYSGPQVTDTDGDDMPNYADLCPLKLGVMLDSDGDGAGDLCDPDPNRWDRWVGPGSSVRNLGAKKQTAFSPEGDGGWLDTDGDGWINSKDTCPFTAGFSANTNGPGEELGFPAGSKRYVRNGYSRRGNACDPFETTFVKARLPPVDTWEFTDCGGTDQNETKYVADTVYVMHASVFGLSSNNPELAMGKTYKERAAIVASRTKAVQTTIERCACDRDDASECFQTLAATCYGKEGLNGNPPVQGTGEVGWLPLGRDTCVEDAEGYCAPIFATAEPKTPLVCDPVLGKCEYASPAVQTVSTKYFPWSWSNEKAKHPDHLPSELFEPQAEAGYSITKHPVLFGSEVGRNAPASSALHYAKTAQAPYFNPLTVFGQEPDVNVSRDPVTGTLPLSAAQWLVQSRRLRSFVSTKSGRLTEGHDVTYKPVACNTWPKQGFDYTDFINIVLPAEPDGMHFSRLSPVSPLVAPRGWALVRTTASAPSQLVALLSLSSGTALPIHVGFLSIAAEGATAPTFAGDLSTLLAVTSAEVAPLATPRDELEPLPALLVVIFGGSREAAGQWLELAPIGPDPSVGLRYAVAASGPLPAGAGPGIVRADSIEGAAVLFSEADSEGPARLWRFEGRQWTETSLLVDVPLRTRAAYLVRGGVLFRAGGASADGALRGDVMAIDSRSGRGYPVTAQYPARLNPALGWDSEQKGLAYGGGYDQAGALHSDLWWTGLESAAPIQLAPDLSGPRLTDDSLVIASGDEPAALVLSTGTSGLPGVIVDAWAGSRAGWQPRDLQALRDGASLASCPDGSAARLCAATNAWWSDPGHVVCGGSGCQGAALRSPSTLDVLPLSEVTATDLDGLGAWVAVGTRVERWTLDHPPARVASLELHTRVRDVRADGALAGVSTEKGFVLVSRTAGGLVASSPVALCGSALSAEPLGGGSWAVATSAGIAFVAPTESGALAIGQAARLVPDGQKWVALPATAGDPSCKPLDAHVCAGHRCDAGRERAPMALARDFVVLSPPLGPKPFELGKPKSGKPFDDNDDWSGASVLLLGHGSEGWRVASALTTAGKLRGMRASGELVFAVTRADEPWNGHAVTPAFRMKGTELVSELAHDVPWWVERRDTLDHRVRVQHGKLELARVGP